MHKIQPKTLFVGKNIVYLPTCHSTNDIASEKIQNGDAIDGTIVITDHQTSGRGQRGNHWEATEGQNITLSLIIKPAFLRPAEQFYLNMAISVALRNFFYHIGLADVSIKWPNDIYVNDKKIAGVLIESTISGNNLNHSVIGIGLNINQVLFTNQRATSLSLEKQAAKMELEPLVEELCSFLEFSYLDLKAGKREEMKTNYQQYLFRFGVPSRFRDAGGDFSGVIAGTDEHGKLIIISELIKKSYDIKEIEYLFD